MGIQCVKPCESGYDRHPLTCYDWIFDWYVLKSYTPSGYTNFESESVCDDGMYKGAALCYRDCNQFDKPMVNCGISACAVTSGQCVGHVVSMAITAVGWMGLAPLSKLGKAGHLIHHASEIAEYTHRFKYM